MLIYSDTEPRGAGGPSRVDPTRAYLRHYDNYLFLQFVSRNSKDPQERGQALRELTIAERKLKFHYRDANKEEVLAGIQLAKRKWL